MKIYRCPICGNIVALVEEGGGQLVCCGTPMELLEANSVDAAAEKHVPVVEKTGDKLLVKCGSVPHPMTEPHYIGWLALETENNFHIIYLDHLGEPEASFPYAEHGTAYAYCNLHGLWKTEF